MNDDKLTYRLDIHPHLLAAILAEQGPYAEEAITIIPDGRPRPGQLTEISKIQEGRKSGELAIYTKSQTPERRELIHEIQKNRAFRCLVEVMETGIGQLKTRVFLEEREHVLGTSELAARFFALPGFLDTRQRKIMAYYLPWLSQIRGDLELTEACFRSSIGHPVKIAHASPLPEKVKGTTIGRWILDSSCEVGGNAWKTAPCVCIEIGPVGARELAGLAPGSRQRRFLEEVLFPQFLPAGWDWQTVIRPESGNENFVVGNDNETAFVGTCTCVGGKVEVEEDSALSS